MKLRMQKVKINNKDIKRIYFEAFPQKERMPFPLMVAMSKLWNTQFFGFYDGDIPYGLIYLASNRKIVFVMFLAVDKYLRSKGYGSFILQQIEKKYPNGLSEMDIYSLLEHFKYIVPQGGSMAGIGNPTWAK